MTLTIELPPGLPITSSYQTLDLPASKQAISLDSPLPLGESYVGDFASPIQWDEFSLMHWDDGTTMIEWDAATVAPQTIDLKR